MYAALRKAIQAKNNLAMEPPCPAQLVHVARLGVGLRSTCHARYPGQPLNEAKIEIGEARTPELEAGTGPQGQLALPLSLCAQTITDRQSVALDLP